MTKPNYKPKSLFLINILIFFLIFCFKSHANDLKEYESMVFVGSYSAKVKIKVFSSLTCPHCANFHKEIVSKIKKEFVDSGNVQLIFIDFPLDQAAFNASKLLHCLEQKQQIKFLDTVYENQNEWANGSNINEINNNLKKIVKNFGINSSKFNTCLVDEAISDKILDGRIKASKEYEISSTPTIIINEKKFKGSVNFKNIKKEIDKII